MNFDENNRPFEVFSIMGKAGGCAASQSEAIARMISFSLRSGIDLKDIIKQLKGISCHSIAWDKSGKILSCADAIAKSLEISLKTHLKATSPVPQAVTVSAPAPAQTVTVGAVTTKRAREFENVHQQKGACPDCGGILEHENGCVTCKGCGYSECG